MAVQDYEVWFRAPDGKSWNVSMRCSTSAYSRIWLAFDKNPVGEVFVRGPDQRLIPELRLSQEKEPLTSERLHEWVRRYYKRALENQ